MIVSDCQCRVSLYIPLSISTCHSHHNCLSVSIPVRGGEGVSSSVRQEGLLRGSIRAHHPLETHAEGSSLQRLRLLKIQRKERKRRRLDTFTMHPWIFSLHVQQSPTSTMMSHETLTEPWKEYLSFFCLLSFFLSFLVCLCIPPIDHTRNGIPTVHRHLQCSVARGVLPVATVVHPHPRGAVAGRPLLLSDQKAQMDTVRNKENNVFISISSTPTTPQTQLHLTRFRHFVVVVVCLVV